GLRHAGRDVRGGGRAFRRARLQQRDRDPGRPDADGTAGAQRRRLGLQETGELRRRPQPRLLSRHSPGGHLAGVVLTTDWGKDFGLPRDTVKGVVCACGMFDLKPVRLSKRGEYVKFTDEMEQALSAQRHLDQINAPVALVYGTLETPEFQRQSRDFAPPLTPP